MDGRWPVRGHHILLTAKSKLHPKVFQEGCRTLDPPLERTAETPFSNEDFVFCGFGANRCWRSTGYVLVFKLSIECINIMSGPEI